MTTSEIVISIDKQITELKAAYEAEITSLRNELVQAKADASAARDVALREGNKATTAVQMAATLIAHFGAVSKLFEDARIVAGKAQAIFGDIESKAASIKQEVAPTASPVAPQAIASVEGVLHSHINAPLDQIESQLEAQLAAHEPQQ
jgi:hypothetical protein